MKERKDRSAGLQRGYGGLQLRQLRALPLDDVEQQHSEAVVLHPVRNEVAVGVGRIVDEARLDRGDFFGDQAVPRPVLPVGIGERYQTGRICMTASARAGSRCRWRQAR